MTEPEAGTKWSVRQAGSLTAEQEDRDELIRAPRLGQNREAAVCALRARALAARPGANPSQAAERTPTEACRTTPPGVLRVHLPRRRWHLPLALAWQRDAGGPSMLTCNRPEER